MDVVKAFNSELSSLYDVKPPISKAKMTGITKSAIKGIKFYKHIVQSVEKFIQKCRPEYKVPGLYVVDSIVRQSRHQFGADKDVFGPRFTKNITTTFQHLFKCVEDDRPRIIRVLNLWQKNSVFPSDVIQPLLDMGHPNTSNESAPTNDDSRVSWHKDSESTRWKGWPQGNDEPPSENREASLEMSRKNLEKFTKAEMAKAIEEEASRTTLYKAQIKAEAEENTVKFNKTLLDFDYGDEEDEEETKNDDSHLSTQSKALALSMAQNFLCNPDLLRQFQQIQQTIQQTETFNSELTQPPVKSEPEESNFQSGARRSPMQQPPLPPTAYQQPCLPPMDMPPSEADKDDRILPQPPLPPKDLDERSLATIMAPHRILPPTSLASFHQTGMPPNQADKDDRIIPDPNAPPRDLDERSLAAILAPLDRGVLPPMPFTEASTMVPYQSSVPFPPQQPPLPIMEAMDGAFPPALPTDMMQGGADGDERVMYSMPGEPPLPPQDFDERAIMMPAEERPRKERSRSRSNSRTRGSRKSRHRSRSRSPRRKRSRSRSPSRKNRSRSKERKRLREKEREREKEGDRNRKGIPPIKKDCVSVCSTTIWMGHVPKSCTELDISHTFGEYGTVLSIDMIPPRGCAFVVMDRRQDAYRALHKLKNLKLHGCSIKMAWAPGKGVKGKEYKDFWEVDAGVSYVPYKKIPEDPEALDLLEEGGSIDEESLSEKLKALRKQPDDKSVFNAMNKLVTESNAASFNAMQAPPMVPPPIIPPTSVNVPMLLHHPMQPQFGLHLPGLLHPQSMVMQVPMGIPPPNPMLMVQQQSQSLLGGQTLPLVGGVSPLVPRTVPLANALQNLKNVPLAEPAIGSPMVPAPTTGDATPTEEEGTSVSSPSAQKSAQTSVSSAVSTQSGIAVTQFNQMMGLHSTNRPLLSVPPPVSASGTPIPYPPPNVGFGFPPPGMRPPGQHGMGPNSQFPWMQKQSSSPFAEGDSRNPAGMPPHMLNARASFHDHPATPVKDAHGMNNRDNGVDRQSTDMDISRRSSSPTHPDKMPQEMVISTDDESSMDRDYSRTEIQTMPRFPSGNDFARLPMNMHRMRVPMGPMPGVRFPPNMPMGVPFHTGMGGPRGPGMHPGFRMDMDFGNGPRSRMPPGSHGMRRGPDVEGRDWYPRDFEGPPFERDRRYQDDRGRDSWEGQDMDSRHGMRNHNNEMRDNRSDSRNRDSRPYDDRRDETPRQRPGHKLSSQKDMRDDLFKLRSYQRDSDASYQPRFRKDMDRRKNENDKPKQETKSGTNEKTDPLPKGEQSTGSTEDQGSTNARKDRDREYRRRSRWGRTLSEEREFQQQKRTEIEIKFQSYEQSAQAAQALLPNPVDSSSEDPSAVPENSAPNMEGVVKEAEPPNAENSTQGGDEPMDSVDAVTPAAMLSEGAASELVSHPAITNLVSESTDSQLIPEPSSAFITAPDSLANNVPESNAAEDESLRSRSTVGTQEQLHVDHVPHDFGSLPEPTGMLSVPSMVPEPIPNVSPGHISSGVVHEPVSESPLLSTVPEPVLMEISTNQTSSIENSIPFNATGIVSANIESNCSEGISNDSDNRNLCEDRNPTKDIVDVSSENQSPLLSAES